MSSTTKQCITILLIILLWDVAQCGLVLKTKQFPDTTTVETRKFYFIGPIINNAMIKATIQFDLTEYWASGNQFYFCLCYVGETITNGNNGGAALCPNTGRFCYSNEQFYTIRDTTPFAFYAPVTAAYTTGDARVDLTFNLQSKHVVIQSGFLDNMNNAKLQFDAFFFQKIKDKQGNFGSMAFFSSNPGKVSFEFRTDYEIYTLNGNIPGDDDPDVPGSKSKKKDDDDDDDDDREAAAASVGGSNKTTVIIVSIVVAIILIILLTICIVGGLRFYHGYWFCGLLGKPEQPVEDDLLLTNRPSQSGGRHRPRPADGSDEDKRSMLGDPKGSEGSGSTNPAGPSETQGPEAVKASDVKVTFTPGGKEQGGVVAAQPTPAVLTAETPAATPPAPVNVPPPPPTPEVMKKKKKKKAPGTKESSSSEESGTTATTTVDTKEKGAPKDAPKAPNLIVVSKAEDLDGPEAKNKNKVQKNYNDVRQPTMTQDPTAVGRPGTVRTKTKMPLVTGKPTPTALGTARPNDKTKTQLATGVVKQETDLNDPTLDPKKGENAGGEVVEGGGTLPVAETQLEPGDDAMTGRGATTVVNTGHGATLVATGHPATLVGTGRPGTVVNTGKDRTMLATGRQGTIVATGVAEPEGEPGNDVVTGRGATLVATGRPGSVVNTGKDRTMVATGRPGTIVATGRPGTIVATGRPGTIVATGRSGTVVATGRTATVMGSQGTQAGTDIDGEHQPGELVPVNIMTAAGTRPTQAATITKTRGVSGTQGGEEATEVATGRGRTTTQGKKLTEGYETRPTQVESRETAAGTLRTGKGRTQKTAGLLTAGTQAASAGTVGTQGTQDPTMLTGRNQTRITGATQMPSSIDEGETQMPTGGAAGVTGGRTGTTQMLTQTTQGGGGGGGTTVTRGGTRTTQAATRTRTQAATQMTQGGTTGGTQGTQEPTAAFNFATGKTQTYATGATQMPSSGGETGETQIPTKTVGGRTGTTQGGKTRTTQGATGTTQGATGTTQGFTGTTQAYTKTQTVGARTSGTQGGSGGGTAATQAGGGTATTQGGGGTATTQGGAGTATTQKRSSKGTGE